MSLYQDDGSDIKAVSSPRDLVRYYTRNNSEFPPLLGIAGSSRQSEDEFGTSRNEEDQGLKYSSSSQHRASYYASDESHLFDFIMERIKSTRMGQLLEKLAVESEPGLTNAQLMLNNHDLKPVEAERRQWGPWNFVGFWVADSFNIVGIPHHIAEA
jgi:NCS1 family nucleobase:cation symporter-1